MPKNCALNLLAHVLRRSLGFILNAALSLLTCLEHHIEYMLAVRWTVRWTVWQHSLCTHTNCISAFTVMMATS
jgi:hypothetical protein